MVNGTERELPPEYCPHGIPEGKFCNGCHDIALSDLLRKTVIEEAEEVEEVEETIGKYLEERGWKKLVAAYYAGFHRGLQAAKIRGR